MEVDKGLLEKIDSLELSDRAKALKEEFLNCELGVAGERDRLAMDSWKETEGEPVDLRWAKLFKKVAEGVPTPIFRGQLLVGSFTKYFRGAYPTTDFYGSNMVPLLEEQKGHMTTGDKVESAIVTDEDYKRIADAVHFWLGKTTADKAEQLTKEIFGTWYYDLCKVGSRQSEAMPHPTGYFGYHKVANEGLCSVIKEAQELIRQWTESIDVDVSKLYFRQAAIIACEGAITLARRYAQTAKEMAAVEKDPEWRAELEEIARICEWVPENPARTFREALQAMILVHVAGYLESPRTPGSSWGLVDQYLLPFFKKDLKEGRLTLQRAAELVSDLLLYSARSERVIEMSRRESLQKGSGLTSIGLGGPDGDGKDASNELSYMILHVMGLAKYPEPHLVIRWHRETPRWLMLKALETSRKVGGGVPQFQNSEHMVEYMTARGVSLENARLWRSVACSQGAPADMPTNLGVTVPNLALFVDLALHDGVASKTGKRIGPATGDPRKFATFEEFYDAYKKQLEYVTRKEIRHDNLCDRVKSDFHRQPLASALMPGCLEKGRDFGNGGLPHYAFWLKKDRGHVSAADSLMAVKKLVYDDKKITMDELVNAIDTNFAGERGEEIRQMCLAEPKYGNDIDEVDKLVCDLGKVSATVICSEKNIFGWPFGVNRHGTSWHTSMGKKTPAMPNGRKDGEPLSDGSLSAAQGMDRNGPTALLNSALKADFKEGEGGILSVKMPTTVFQTEETREKLLQLTEGFLSKGGTYIQYNIVDANVLKDAKRNPEKYRDLLVRVGGFSAYFVKLSPEVQDELIWRTEHNLAD